MTTLELVDAATGATVPTVLWLRIIVAHNRPTWATFTAGDPVHVDRFVASTMLAFYASLDLAERTLYTRAMVHCRDCLIDCGTIAFDFALGHPVSLADIRHRVAT